MLVPFILVLKLKRFVVISGNNDPFSSSAAFIPLPPNPGCTSKVKQTHALEDNKSIAASKNHSSFFSNKNQKLWIWSCDHFTITISKKV